MSVQQQVFSEAVQYALQFGRDQGSPSIRAVTVLVAAVISAQQPDALPDSFAQVRSFKAYYHSLCLVTQLDFLNVEPTI